MIKLGDIIEDIIDSLMGKKTFNVVFSQQPNGVNPIKVIKITWDGPIDELQILTAGINKLCREGGVMFFSAPFVNVQEFL